MELFYFIGFILNFCFCVYFGFMYFKFTKDSALNRVSFLILLLTLSFLVSSFFYFLWSFGIINYNVLDFKLISSVIIFFKIVILLLIFSIIFDNYNILFFLLFYTSVIFSIFLSVNVSNVVFLISFLIVLLISLIVFSKKEFEKIGLFGLFYSFASAILFFLLFFELLSVEYIILLLNIFIFLFLFELVSLVYKNYFILFRYRKLKYKSSFILDFLKYFVFIVVLANFVFVATVSVHELGHYIPAQFLDCDYTKIVYESGLPRTEILCQSDNYENYMITLLGGLFVPFIISFFFFFSGGTFIREIGLLIAGFNFIISYKDLIDMGFSGISSLFISVVGILCVIIALGLLASSRVEEHKFIDFTEGHKSFYNQKGS